MEFNLSKNFYYVKIILWALLLINFEVFASGKITGKVFDKTTGEPLIGANILINELLTGASTDASGEYLIINVRPGVYSIKASYVGYNSVTKTEVTVITNRTVKVDFELEVEVFEQEDIVVTAERPPVVKDLTASEQILDGDELSKSFVRTIPEALETQTGVFQGYYRGATQVEVLYRIDNVNLNSGLFSDNYTGINTSTIQEIAVLTGGYNAEYGNARSAIIDVTTKEDATEIHGTLIARMRPPGQYHFGRNMFSKDNYEWTHFDYSYWQAQALDENSQFFGDNPDSLLSLWQQQITPNDTLKKYTERIEYETEATIYGPITDKLSFLASGRFVNNVNIYPQAIPTNPEFNFQGNLKYKFSPTLELKINGLFGGWESAEDLATNFNSTESAQESQWYSKMQVTDPYMREKYALMGAFLYQWPEKREWIQLSSQLTHFLSNETFYEVSFSFLRDEMDRSDRQNIIPDTLYALRDDRQKLVRFLDQGYMHAYDKTRSDVFSLKADLTSQLHRNHLLKTGINFRYYDFFQDHFMVEYKGGGNENFVNQFDGTPYEGAAYVQDKMEFPGLVVNAGLRFDFFNQNRSAPINKFDPLAFQLESEGHDPNEPYGFPGNPPKKRTELQYAFSPRIGISHPISENAVLHFVYGHFNQRPSFSKMFGFPTVSYTEDEEAAKDQYGDQVTYMEEWHGYYGNPDLTYERTIQYEVGIDYNINGNLLLDVTGYYKDATKEANFSAISGLYPRTHYSNKALMVYNGGYSDVRGIESKFESKFDSPFNFGVSHDIFWSWAGVTGYSRLYEPGADREDVPKGLRYDKGAWSSFHKIKAWVSINYPKDSGPELFDIKPLSDAYAFLYFWWRSGDPYTYHAPGETSTKPNNRTWFNYYQINLKLAKAVQFLGVRTEISLDIYNLLDSKFYRRLFGDDLIRWHERGDLKEEERLPKHSFSNEPNEWAWYSYEVPPRQVYFQVKFDF